MPPAEVMLNIVSNESPTIDEKWSPDFHDFVKECLQKNPETRWSVEMLLEHPFVAGAGTEEKRSEWIQELMSLKYPVED